MLESLAGEWPPVGVYMWSRETDMGVFKRKGANSAKAEAAQPEPTQAYELVAGSYCSNGHNLISGAATFAGYDGITLKLKNDHQEGLLALSPIIGDKDRTFFDTKWTQGEIVDICCPTCSEPLPVYNECACGANLIAIFTTTKSDFSDCIGICQRIGCTHSEITSNKALRAIKPIRFF